MSSAADSSSPKPSLASRGKIPISELVVTQFGYRADSQVEAMIYFVSHGGEFSATPKVALFELDDGRLYIHDGHHRSMAIYLSGRDCLLPTEYVLTKNTFAALQSVNFDVGYVTPYDPRCVPAWPVSTNLSFCTMPSKILTCLSSHTDRRCGSATSALSSRLHSLFTTIQPIQPGERKLYSILMRTSRAIPSQTGPTRAYPEW